MSIRAFCDSAFAIIVDDHQRAGASLESILTHLSEWAVGVTRSKQEREEELIARRNTENLASVGIDMEALFS